MEKEAKNITIADVADALGVSRTTVSRAISGKGRIGKETRARVMEYIEKYEYKPNVIAKGLAQSKTYNLCVVLPGDYAIIDLHFFQDCLFGIQQIAGGMDYDLLLSICKNNDLSSLDRVVSNHKVDGVILMRTFVDDAQVEYLLGKNIPFVTVGSSDYDGVIQIDHNHRCACKELTNILLLKGMKRLALIGGEEGYSVNRERIGGFKEAYEEMGLPIEEELLFLNLDNHIVVDKKVEEILNEHVDGILCLDDGICGKVLRALREKNVEVPKDIKVASFYNSTVLENNVPSITSLDFDAKEIGMVACQTLLDLIEKKEVEQRTLLSYQVVLKESTL